MLVSNLVLFAGILSYFLRAQLAAPVPPPDAPAAAEVRPASSRAPGKVAGPASASVATNSFQWAQLESEDYKTYVARLRAIGCPEQTVRDIIIADLDKLFAPELRAAAGRRKDLKYWNPEEEEMLNDIDPRELSRQERELDRRKREIIQELVDADLVRERSKASGQEDYYERRLKFLPETLQTKVRELLEKFDQAEQELRDKETGEAGGLSAADRAQLRLIHQQRMTEVESVLSPQQKHLYELWLSPVANQVRHATYGMDATEEEFSTVYSARKAFDDAWGLRDPELLDPVGRQQMEQDRADMEARIQAGLGEQRYAELKRGEDDDFHLLRGLVTRFKLPKEKAAEVYGYKTVTLSYQEQLRADASLTPQQKQEAMAAITAETRKTVREVLGPKAYSYYLRSGQAQWIGH